MSRVGYRIAWLGGAQRNAAPATETLTRQTDDDPWKAHSRNEAGFDFVEARLVHAARAIRASSPAAKDLTEQSSEVWLVALRLLLRSPRFLLQRVADLRWRRLWLIAEMLSSEHAQYDRREHHEKLARFLRVETTRLLNPLLDGVVVLTENSSE